MNLGIFCGKIATVPEVKVLPLDVDKHAYICKFVLCSSRDSIDGIKYDFFQCVAFDSAAQTISERFNKGIKVTAFGKFVNHVFTDENGTRHLSDVLLVEQIEYGDNVTLPFVRNTEQKDLEKPVSSEIKIMDDMFEEAQNKGFVCLNENDYFDIAASNLVCG